MPGLNPCSRYYQMIFVCVLLLQICVLAFGIVPPNSGSHGTPEESSSGSGSGVGLLPHNEETSAADNAELDFVKRLYNFGLGKRAYSYVSEYKRLPVYNFGLGKRSKLYGFGLGKRAEADRNLYSFGLGKRDYDDYFEDDEDVIDDEDDDLDDADDNLMEKRERLYSFGLGKRAKPYTFGLGKRSPSSGVRRIYGFGLGKRGGSLYSFGLGKREGRLYSFGLGKRPVNFARQSGSRFNFGLGKRSDESDWDDFEEDVAEVDKKSPQEHRFAFGLGKREVAPGELEAVRDEEREKETEHVTESRKNGTAESSHHSGERVKRSLHYAFGLGKRAYDSEPSVLEEDGDNEAGVEEFARTFRRPFNFGLGKRIPMYDFGIGKRSEH